MADVGDYDLIKRCLNGDNSAFDLLVKRYERQMYRTAWGIVKNSDTAKDITQTGFLKCWKKLHTYNPDFKFYSWLYRIMVNESLNHLRNKKTHSSLSLYHSSGENPYLKLLKKEENRILAKCIGELPTDYRVVIQLRHFEELSYKEIAGILDIEPKTVKSRLYTARIQLREKLL
ncbi:MAG: sigma-70 family RNA polymerase sigma factor [Gracilimonas sp.]|uniref:RNA polymerase sigma factor n=1 Tax=Gracilimonas TaxID=649462 RepID=UPI001B0500EE|nr:sigma-70 family RNA polymerase sigma factor [Gracilimonas sp.]MBO6585927.1 sigma-70 family RNA polymerase sigma factor [Gracilimonas sp.]MBO6616924.1 sigma-70 family RNA polymerase sigma factor [Gracilimonas sp.]